MQRKSTLKINDRTTPNGDRKEGLARIPGGKETCIAGHNGPECDSVVWPRAAISRGRLNSSIIVERQESRGSRGSIFMPGTIPARELCECECEPNLQVVTPRESWELLARPSLSRSHPPNHLGNRGWMQTLDSKISPTNKSW